MVTGADIQREAEAHWAALSRATRANRPRRSDRRRRQTAVVRWDPGPVASGGRGGGSGLNVRHGAETMPTYLGGMDGEGLAEDEVALVLRRATQLDGASTPDPVKRTPQALEAAAVEVGLSRDAVRQALAEMRAGTLHPPMEL